MPGIYRIQGTFKNYDWGGISFIPSLLQIENTDGRPFAEYWLGTHAQDNCVIELPDHHSKLLRDYIAEDPSQLGEETQKRFGRLPYLLKLLDVKDMLSIQVHPSKAAAEKEFAAENAAGVPLDSPQRNYKDDNHKPELMVAMSDFWLLYGFKPEKELIKILRTVPVFNEFLPVFKQAGYEGLYKKVMEMPQEEVNRVLQPLLDLIIPLYKEKKLKKKDEDFWAARAALTFKRPGIIDRGIFSIYFFNLLQLKKGEATYQEAGLPHAYLEGQNAEIMASSDNVLRGGLTNKHIDVKELLKHVKCEPTTVNILAGEKLNSHEKAYQTPAPDFELHVFELSQGESVSFKPVTAEIMLLSEGVVELTDDREDVQLKKGSPSAIVFPGQTVRISAWEKAIVFRATVPVHRGE